MLFKGELEGQPEHPKEQQEQREQEIYKQAMWLGGLFEAGGSMTYIIHKNIKRQGLYVYARPIITFADNDEERVIKLKQFGGYTHKDKRGSSWEWILKDHLAITLANA